MDKFIGASYSYGDWEGWVISKVAAGGFRGSYETYVKNQVTGEINYWYFRPEVMERDNITPTPEDDVLVIMANHEAGPQLGYDRISRLFFTGDDITYWCFHQHEFHEAIRQYNSLVASAEWEDTRTDAEITRMATKG